MLLDFSFSNKDKDVALNKAKALFYDNILPELNQTFDVTTEHLYIDKLEVDIGITSVTDFAEKFSVALKEALQKFVAGTSHQQLENISTNDLKDKKDLSVDDIIFFLQHGYWQWNIQNKQEEEIIKLIEQFIKNRQLMFTLFNKINTDNTINLKRFTDVFTLNKAANRQLFYSLIDYHSYLKTIESFIETIYKRALAGGENFYEAFVHKLYQSERLETFADFKKFIINFINEHVDKARKVSSSRQSIINKLNHLLNTHTDNVKEIFPLLETILSSKNIFLSDEKNKSVSDTIPFFKDGEKEKININNAGLVLLHPYLPFLFKELKLIDESKNFIDVAAQQKAILYLQFLINNKRNQQEHLLVLNKILCGYPVHMPLKIKHQFAAEDLKAGEEMLDALIEHWTVLKNTSRKGLIESFIKRKGLIQKTGNDFVVQVEKNSIDILLDSLPFGIRTIKLPWNEYIIYTEWSY